MLGYSLRPIRASIRKKMSLTQHPLLSDASQHPEDPHYGSSFSGSDTEKSLNGFVESTTARTGPRDEILGKC